MDDIKFRLQVFCVVLMIAMLIGAFGFMGLEGLSLIDAFYFSIVTIATVGYGDIHPVTVAGKMLSLVLIIGGVGTFLGVVANATEMLLKRREDAIRLQKTHMVVGLFFSEVGTRLLKYIARMDPGVDLLRQAVADCRQWSAAELMAVRRSIGAYAYGIDVSRGDLSLMRDELGGKSQFLLRLLENPMLLENEAFTELLRAVFHLRDEMLLREDLSLLPDTDRMHLAGDIQRVYRLMVSQWLEHMKHLKDHYPYLFSLAVRTNPFDPFATPVVS